MLLHVSDTMGKKLFVGIYRKNISASWTDWKWYDNDQNANLPAGSMEPHSFDLTDYTKAYYMTLNENGRYEIVDSSFKTSYLCLIRLFQDDWDDIFV